MLFVRLMQLSFISPGATADNLGSFGYASSLGHLSSESLFISPRTRPRLPIGKPKILLAIGGQAPKAIRSVEGYDFKEDRWVNISEMPNRRCRCGVAVVRGKYIHATLYTSSLIV